MRIVNKKISAFVVIISIIIFILAIFGNPYQNSSKPTINSENNDVFPSVKDISIKYFSTLASLNLTSEPKFEEGENYIYTIWYAMPAKHIATLPGTEVFPQPAEYTVKMFVDKKERISGDLYYKIDVKSDEPCIYNYTIFTDGKYDTYLRIFNMSGYLYHINAKNGNTSMMIQNSNSMCSFCVMFFSQWMLYLSENIGWNEEIRKEDNEQSALVSEMSYEVESIEKINGKSCFKVVVTGYDTMTKTITDKVKTKTDTMKVLKKEIYFVDVKKRVLVRMESFEDNVLYIRIDLKDMKKI